MRFRGFSGTITSSQKRKLITSTSMWLELSVIGLVLAAALWPLLVKTRSRSARAGAVFLLILTVLGAFALKSRAHAKVSFRSQFLEKIPREEHPGGYVRSETCRSCHPDQYASWHRSFHRTMTQRASAQSVRGAFTNVTLTLNGEEFHLSSRGEELWAEMVDPDWKYVRALQQQAFEQGRAAAPEFVATPPRSLKRITMTTGSHHMQAYWVASKFGNEQFSFPFTYLFEDQRWVPRNDVFLGPPERPHLQQVWNANCIICHATAGVPNKDEQTRVFDSRAAELGIACESCHGPASEHVRINTDPRRRYGLRRVKKSDPTILNPARLSSKKASEVCSQCHASRYTNDERAWLARGFSHRPGDSLDGERPLPHPAWLGHEEELGLRKRENSTLIGGTFWRDGMVRVSGREYNGLIESGCFKRGELSCLSCHSMHHMASADDQLKPAMDGNEACAACHQTLTANPQPHTHHPPNSSGSLCYNCHMPFTTYGLLKAIRSHQISSPNVAITLASGRPNACNLCHLDKPLHWTATNLVAWFKHSYVPLDRDLSVLPASVVWLLRGDAGQRAIVAWHMGWDSAKQVSGDNWLAPYLGEALNDPYSAVRYVAQRSLKRLPGFSSFQYDYIAPPEARADAQRRLLQTWNAHRGSRSALLIAPADFARLLEARDNHPMELLE